MGEMSSIIQFKKPQLAVFVIVIVTVICVLLYRNSIKTNAEVDWGIFHSPNMDFIQQKPFQSSNSKTKLANAIYFEWPKFEIIDISSETWLKTKCISSNTELSLDNILDVLKLWSRSSNALCRDIYRQFMSMFSITSNPAKIVIPESFATKVRKWLGNNEQLFQATKKQVILYIYNEYTREENVFNPLREKRPMGIPEIPERKYVDDLSKKTEATCDFCNYKNFTAEDVFGRIESKYSFSAANTFKLGAWHTLLLTRAHHPLNWDMPVFLDLMQSCQKWIDKVHKYDSKFTYPMMVMDMLPHGGASQVHPHIHVFVDTNRYQGAVENWRVAADLYFTDFKRNYFSDLVAIHSALGLSVTYGKAVAFASILPKKDNEVVILSENVNEDYFKLIYFVYRAFIDDMEKLCYSSGYAFPSKDPEDSLGRIPAYTRIITRGAVAEIRSDISSLELFTSQNANTNPYKVIDFVRKSIKKRDT